MWVMAALMLCTSLPKSSSTGAAGTSSDAATASWGSSWSSLTACHRVDPDDPVSGNVHVTHRRGGGGGRIRWSRDVENVRECRHQFHNARDQLIESGTEPALTELKSLTRCYFGYVSG